jgi:AraC-like DNA-binding protein
MLLSLTFPGQENAGQTVKRWPLLQPDRTPQSLVARTCDYILLHLALPLTISSISKAMHTNRNSLSKAFRQELNIGVSEWLRKQRMEKARQLLVSTNLSIQEISIQLGYPVQANFSTSFKNQFNQSPIQIRRSINNA